ncbi:MAG TPA: hypothetical protein VGO93_13695 [Candidatus Xenobia bacterium]|jgi:hypothetical protein
MLRLLPLLLFIALMGSAHAAPAERPSDDRTLQVYYHLTYFEAVWRSEDEPGILFRESLVLGGVTVGLRLLRRVIRRGVLA